MLGLLAGLTDWESADEQRQRALRNALDSYQKLAAEVADAWTRHWPDGAAASTPPPGPRRAGGLLTDAYRYQFNLATEDGGYTTLKLTRTVESGPGGVGWPERIECVTPTGRFPLTQADREACGCPDDSACRCYTFTEPVPAGTLLTFELTFPPVHVARYQNASAATWVTRNARLLGEGWPDTDPDFVYRTPEARCPAPVVPFIDVTSAIAIGAWQPPDGNPLLPAFAAIFDGDPADRTVAVGARYEYTLVPADPPVSALLPVVQSTVGGYGDSTVPDVTEALTDWSDREQPETAGGAWAFRISLYSSVDPTLQRPVLQLRHLVSALAR